MKSKLTTRRILSFLILFGLVIAQLGAVQPVQAATDVSLALDSTTYAGLPGQGITVRATETFGDFSREKNNITYDLLFTFSVPVGTDLRDTSVQAYTSGGAQIGQTIRLNSGQTYLWASAFGGALSRQKVKGENGTSHMYQFVFTPTASMAGKTIGVKAQIAIAKSGFTATSAWKYSSNAWNADLKVRSLPVLTAERISGPYKNNVEGTFRIEVANPDPELIYTGLYLKYQIDNDGTTAPNIKSLKYRYSLDNGSTWSTLTNIPKTQGGEFGPSTGYTLAAGQKLLVEVAIAFTSTNTQLFPFTLSTEYPLGKTLESLSAIAAVEIDKARLASNDLGVTYNAGIAQEFHLTAVNQPDTGGTFTDAYMKLTFGGMAPADIAQLQYYSPSDGQWKDVSPITATGSGAVGKYGPFTLDTLNNISRTVKFRASFTRPGTYATAATLETIAGTPIADAPLLATVVVSASYPSLDLTDILNNSPFAENTLQEFVVGISNPATGGAYNTLRLDCVISSASLADVLQFDYSLDNGGTWVPITLSPNGGGVSGSVNPSNWQLTVPANISVKFRINFAAAQDHVMTFTLVNQAPSVTLATSSAYILLPGIPVTGGDTLFLPTISNFNG